MATFRENPYSAFNFHVSLGGDQGDGAGGSIIGGFSDVSGLSREVSYGEYRNGNELVNTVRKIPNISKFDDITLKRGLIASRDLFAWIDAVSRGDSDPRTVTITLLDEAREPVASWVLTRAQPKKWTGPTLGAKGGTDVAMEELVFCHEGITFE